MSVIRRYTLLWILIMVAAMTAVAALLPRLSLRLYLVAWLINLVLTLVIVGVISYSKANDPNWDWQGGWFAILVDDRNKYSLSRLQIMLWTIIVISAFWTIAIARGVDSLTADHAADYVCEAPAEGETPTCAAPADLQLPTILWGLLGISMTSAVASPLIKGNKEERTMAKTDNYKSKLMPDTRGKPVKDTNGAQVMVNGQALISKFDTLGAVSRRVKGPPLISDMFMSEDPQNEYVLDIGKVQNFFFVIVAVVIYGFTLAAEIAGAGSISALFQFPDFSEGLVAILGISTAGYLVDKAADTGPDPGP